MSSLPLALTLSPLRGARETSTDKPFRTVPPRHVRPASDRYTSAAVSSQTSRMMDTPRTQPRETRAAMSHHVRFVAIAVAAALLASGSLVAQAASTSTAQGYPLRPIRFIVAYPPGGGADIVAR